MADISELEERIKVLEVATFGKTREEAQQYLKDMGYKQRTMSPEFFDNWCSRNMRTIERAERCVGA